jgi:transcriptional regulator with XRE-family HTH domain
VASGDSPAVARRRLRLALRKVREEVGLTQGQVASALEWSISKVNRIETGEVTISNTDLQALLNLLGVVDSAAVEQHMEDARAARRRGWWTEPRYRAHHTAATLQLLQFETEATEIRIFQTAVFPGLLQTSDYATSIIDSIPNDVPEDTRTVRVEVRMRRQAQLVERLDPPELLVVIDEFVPSRPVGTPRVMLDQLKALLEAARRPNVHIRILPKEEIGFVVLGAFTIYGLSGDENAVLYREEFDELGSGYAPEVIRAHRRYFEKMWDVSLKEEATLALLEAHFAAVRAALNRNP